MRALVFVAAVILATPHAAPAQWQLQLAPTTADLRGIDNVGNGIAWASGSNGTILHTTDSGAHWQRCTTPPNADNLDFRGIQAFDATTAIAMSSGPGDQSRLYKTTNACQSWTLLFTNPDKTGFFDALAIVPQQRHKSRRELLLLGDPVRRHFALWSVRIGGKSDGAVKRLWSPPRAKPHEAAFAASNSVLFVYGSGYWFLLGTGGQRGARFLNPEPTETGMGFDWSRVPVGGQTESSGVFSIGLALKPTNARHQLILHSGNGVDHSYAVAVGGDYLKPDQSTAVAAHSMDHGRRWHPATTQPHGYRSSVAYDAPTRTWITVGPNGTDISTDDGHNWRALKPSPGEAPDADQHWNALSLPFVVGPHGRIGILSPAALKP